jgi:hypothetical protein
VSGVPHGPGDSHSAGFLHGYVAPHAPGAPQGPGAPHGPAAPTVDRPAPMQMAGAMPAAPYAPPTSGAPPVSGPPSSPAPPVSGIGAPMAAPTYRPPVYQPTAPAAPTYQPPPGQPGPSQPGPSQPGPSLPGPAQPAPVQPGAVTQRRLRPVDDFPPVVDPSGAVPCRHCGIGNEHNRRFCRRCGNPLAVVVEERLSWWRRFLRWLRRPFRSEPREAGYRPRRRGGGVRFSTVLLTALLAILLIVGLTPSLRNRAIDGTVDGFNALRDKTKDPVLRASRNPGASSIAAGRDPKFVNDGAKDTYWAPDKAAPALDEYVQVEMENPERIVSIILHAGAAPDRPTFLTQARPREIEVLFLSKGDDGKERVETKKTVTLKDQPGPQTFVVRGSDVTSVRLIIKSAYGAEPGRQVALAEVELFVRP